MVLRFFYSSGNKQFEFKYGNTITGPSGDALTGGGYEQAITGTYRFGSLISPGVYSLTRLGGGTSAVTVGDGTNNYLTASSLATEIDFNTHNIKWSDVTGVTVNNTIGSQALSDLASSATYAFTSFTFQAIANESAWLAGTDTGQKYTTYYLLFQTGRFRRCSGAGHVDAHDRWPLRHGADDIPGRKASSPERCG